MSNKPDNLATNFNSAVWAYRNALYGDATLTSGERETFCEEFQFLIQEFKHEEKSYQAILEVELESVDVYRYNTAARLLIEMSNPEPLRMLSEQIIQTSKPRLTDKNLRLLWIAVRPELNLFERLAGRWEQLPFLRAFLNEPSMNGSTLINRLLNDNNAHLASFAIEASSSWIDKDMLKRFMNKPPMLQVISDYEYEDERFVAAFHLALRGDADAISFLESSANGNNLIQASWACYNLAQLALPSVLKPAEKLLRSRDTEVIKLTVATSVIIGSPMLIPALLTLIKWNVNTRIDPKPIPDLAIQALRQIIGVPVERLIEKYIPDSNPAEYTDTYREQVATVCLEIVPNFLSGRRYYSGVLVTLAHLAENLLSRHSGSTYAAIYNLQAITGENYGFNPNADLITNLPAIKAWRKRAQNPQPLIPGGWAFRGTPLATPL